MASIEHRPNSTGETWRVVWRQTIGDVRAKQQATFATPDEAEQFRKLVEGYGNAWPPGYEPTRPGPAAGLTFGEWAEKAVGRRTRASERTKNDYRRDLERHFADLLPRPLDGIDGEDVVNWLEEIQETVYRGQPIAGKTVRNLHGFASSLFVDALAQHPPIVTHNPFAGKLADVAAVRVEEMVFLTPQEFATVLKWVREEYAPLIRFLYGTGMRYGEATALRVGDIDLFGKRKTATVTKAWKRTGTAEWVIGEPKTRRSRRTISLSPELVDMLIPLVSARKASELLFPGADGGRLPHVDVYKRGWAPAVARANVCDVHYEPQRTKRSAMERPRLPAPCDCPGVLGKTPRLHDCRHSHVAALIADGVQLPAISRRLGHSSITITFDRYGHLDPSLDAAIDAATDRALAPQR